ncbi:MAG: peptidase MA family metallohydrolase [Chitinispirillaceae bacterium]
MKFSFFIVLFNSYSFAGTLFDLQGRVPSSISPAFLTSNYVRIWKAVAPDTAVNRNPIAIIYYSRSDERKLGVRLPEWGGGGAIGKDTIIVPIDRFPLSDMDLGRVTVHELVHIALERAYGLLRIPRWFHEGLAMTLSGELSFDEQLTLSRAIFTKKLMPLDSIERVNRFDAFGAALAYSESHLAVAYMIDKYGIDGIPELLNEVRAAGKFDTSLFTVFGFAPQEYDRMVHNYIIERYRFLFFFSDTYLFWMLGAFLVIAGFIAVRIRIRKREKQMEEEENAADEREKLENNSKQ